MVFNHISFEHLLRAVENTIKINPSHFLPFIGSYVGKQLLLCNSRIVDKHIKISESAVNFVKHLANAFIIGNICLNSKGIYAVFICKFFCKAFGFFGIFRVMQRNIATAFCKSNGSLRTDSAGRTCYKYFFHHINTR